jgi:protein gp37
MGEKTEISWADSTFNPWIGCQKVSAGCDNCYAETLMDKRYHRVQWGPHGERVRTSESNWRNPVKWNRNAASFQAEHGHRQRVFCASLADVFDNQVPEDWRNDLWRLIRDTPNLDWLLLTKRPENVMRMLSASWSHWSTTNKGPLDWQNVWLGFTAEDQSAFDRRWPIMAEIPAAVRFCSYEPAIGPLFIRGAPGLNWLICGGESGPKHRPMDSKWATLVKNDCCRLEIPFFMKQMSGRACIPPDLMVRQFPKAV